MRVSGEIVAMALNATEWHRSQIQGFVYETADGTDLHVVRDVTKDKDAQVLWTERAPRPEHDAAFARKMLAKERAEADLIAERINVLLGS